MNTTIPTPTVTADLLRAVLRACASSPRPIPRPEIAPNSPIGGAR